jgi:hypothetical protein
MKLVFPDVVAAWALAVIPKVPMLHHDAVAKNPLMCFNTQSWYSGGKRSIAVSMASQSISTKAKWVRCCLPTKKEQSLVPKMAQRIAFAG